MKSNVLNVVRTIKENIPERSIDGAKKLAQKMIKDLKLTSYPVPIVSIMDDLGFKVYVSDMPNNNISGFICINPDLCDTFDTDRIVAVSNKDITGRQRFTLAHEFAHYLFDFDDNKMTEYFDTYNIVKSDENSEKIPSRFAAEFLMPEDIFVKRYMQLANKNIPRYDLIATLVGDFNVSQKAVLKRCSEVSDKIGCEV